MRNIVLSVLILAAIQISTPLVASADDDGRIYDDNVPLVRVLQNAVLPPGTAVTLSLSNVSNGKNLDQSATPCNPVEGYVWFLGGTGSSSESFSTNDLSTATTSLELLDKIPVNLAPGEVMAVDFVQPFSASETVLMALAVPPKSKRCLAASSATAQIPGAGLAIIPSAPATGDELDVLSYSLGFSTGGTERPMACCACAPICGCGLCDP